MDPDDLREWFIRFSKRFEQGYLDDMEKLPDTPENLTRDFPVDLEAWDEFLREEAQRSPMFRAFLNDPKVRADVDRFREIVAKRVLPAEEMMNNVLQRFESFKDWGARNKISDIWGKLKGQDDPDLILYDTPDELLERFFDFDAENMDVGIARQLERWVNPGGYLQEPEIPANKLPVGAEMSLNPDVERLQDFVRQKSADDPFFEFFYNDDNYSRSTLTDLQASRDGFEAARDALLEEYNTWNSSDGFREGILNQAKEQYEMFGPPKGMESSEQMYENIRNLSREDLESLIRNKKFKPDVLDPTKTSSTWNYYDALIELEKKWTVLPGKLERPGKFPATASLDDGSWVGGLDSALDEDFDRLGLWDQYEAAVKSGDERAFNALIRDNWDQLSEEGKEFLRMSPEGVRDVIPRNNIPQPGKNFYGDFLRQTEHPDLDLFRFSDDLSYHKVFGDLMRRTYPEGFLEGIDGDVLGQLMRRGAITGVSEGGPVTEMMGGKYENPGLIAERFLESIALQGSPEAQLFDETVRQILAQDPNALRSIPPYILRAIDQTKDLEALLAVSGYGSIVDPERALPRPETNITLQQALDKINPPNPMEESVGQIADAIYNGASEADVQRLALDAAYGPGTLGKVLEGQESLMDNVARFMAEFDPPSEYGLFEDMAMNAARDFGFPGNPAQISRFMSRAIPAHARAGLEELYRQNMQNPNLQRIMWDALAPYVEGYLETAGFGKEPLFPVTRRDPSVFGPEDAAQLDPANEIVQEGLPPRRLLPPGEAPPFNPLAGVRALSGAFMEGVAGAAGPDIADAIQMAPQLPSMMKRGLDMAVDAARHPRETFQALRGMSPQLLRAAPTFAARAIPGVAVETAMIWAITEALKKSIESGGEWESGRNDIPTDYGARESTRFMGGYRRSPMGG